MTAISAASAAAPAPPAAAKKTTLGQADFIRLMTTQMKLQDPLEPVDNKEMIAQMAALRKPCHVFIIGKPRIKF